MTKQHPPATTKDSQNTSESTEHQQMVEVSMEQAVIEEQTANKVANDDKVVMDYPGWLGVFEGWLNNTRNNEVKNLMAFFDRSREWWETATELTSEEFSQKSTFLKRDLMMFYRHYQQDLSQSEYFQSLKESVWQELADLTDKSQIEWHELKQDFDHDGIYHKGDWVGMGVMICRKCHYQMEYSHPEQLSACPQCSGGSFLREALAP